MKEKLVSERAQVEGGIGAVKSSRYNFHRPRARSVRMMGACGQLASAIAEARWYSFPSGHAMGSFITFGALAYLVLRQPWP
jgi:membrane-associated phospholipid phosphatase